MMRTLPAHSNPSYLVKQVYDQLEEFLLKTESSVINKVTLNLIHFALWQLLHTGILTYGGAYV